MSILKSRELAHSGKQNEIEGNIRELVRQQGGTIHRPDVAGEQATNELSNLLREVSLHSMREGRPSYRRSEKAAREAGDASQSRAPRYR